MEGVCEVVPCSCFRASAWSLSRYAACPLQGTRERRAGTAACRCVGRDDMKLKLDRGVRTGRCCTEGGGSADGGGLIAASRWQKVTRCTRPRRERSSRPAREGDVLLVAERGLAASCEGYGIPTSGTFECIAAALDGRLDCRGGW